MRIISGQAGGIPLRVPEAVTRPTTDKVRQALFSALGELVPEARVLDLFAGSGALGLECLSRGAASCLFIEQHRGASEVIKANLTKARLPNGTIRCADALRAVEDLATTSPAGFDLIFADPPYTHSAKDRDWSQALLQSPHLPKLLAPNGLLILECMAKGDAPLAPHWTLFRDRSYGSTRLLWLTPTTSCSAEASA
jgi:16S rRNA (guanine966-N2)-methyltransferase